ncbi:MAG: CHAT domain-containing protein [Acidobacteria bacterium]|nr:CHAT domain-containing protein [Acidobacteriota bacterium]
MIRRSLGLAACLLLAGCAGRREAAIEKEYQTAQAELRQGRLAEAQKRAEGCELRWARSLTGRQRWRLRLLKADVLVARGQSQEALPLVASAAPPAAWAAELELRRQVILATIWSRDGKTRQKDALELLERAGAEAQGLGDSGTSLEIENIRFNVLMGSGEPAAAEECIIHAVALARKARNDYWLAGSLLNLAYVRNRDQFRHDEAARFGEEAIEAARRAGTDRFLGAAYGNTSQALGRLGAFEKAVRYRRQALELQRRVEDRRQVRVSLGQMGNLFALWERHAEAVDWHKQAFDYSEKTGGALDAARSAGNLATAHIALEQWDDAEAWNQRAAELKRQTGDGASLGYQKLNAAQIADGRGQSSEAGRLYREVLFEERDNPGLRFDAEVGIGKVCAKTGAAGEARRHFEAALRLVESNRDAIERQEYQITFLARMIRAWREYVDFLVSQGRTEAAFEVAERSRAQVLAGRLRAHEDGIARSVPLTRLRQVAARQRCTFLSYWLGPKWSAVWIADASGLRMRRLPPASEIDRLVEAWRRRIEEQTGDALETGRQAGDRLAALLLEGVDLKTAKRLVVVPDGSLHGLNLESLPMPGRKRYLLEEATIVLAPSLAVFATDRAGRARPARQALLVGVGQPGDAAYPPLPKAEDEVRSITARWPADRRVLLTGAAATPAAIRNLDLRRFGFIHLAAHAEANRESPLDSAVILARGGEESKLYAREIASLPLNAELVTLSACRSAGARAYSGEGLVGLTWAVLSGGARNVIAALWPVSDSATFLLMENLYAALSRGTPPASALREAKLAMLGSSGAFRQPFYWAPLQIYVRGAEF